MRFSSFARVALVSLSFALPLAGCATEEEEAGELSDDVTSASLSSRTLTSAKSYDTFSTAGGGFGQSGRSMKFLIDRRAKGKDDLYFVNGNFKVGGKTPQYAKYHYFFAQKQLGIGEDGKTFNDETYYAADKTFVAGTIQTYTLGDDKERIYAIQLYPDDVANEKGLLAIAQAITAAFKIPNARLYFVATGDQQTTKTVAKDFQDLGVKVSSVEELLGAVKFLPLNPGEAWGYLRMFPKDVLELRPTDIPVFDELPLDISVVAGSITRVFQDVTSHVNLKAKERGTPNMVLRDADTNDALKKLKDKPVHLTVSKDGYVLEPSTAEIVARKLAEKVHKPWITLPSSPISKVTVLDELCPAHASDCLKLGPAFGGKVTGLGFLANRDVVGRPSQAGSAAAKLGYEIVPHGFGIPVQAYRDFLASPDNATLKAKLDDLITQEKTGKLSPKERAARASEVQSLFYHARVPAPTLTQVTAQLTALGAIVHKLDDLKFRSSANAEDIPNFDGAGLHDSFSVDIDDTDNADLSCEVIEEAEGGVVTKLKIKPRTPQCAIKAVYASLWNPRAIDERSFARIDHATAAMGIAVVPAYDTEADYASNGVIITRAVNTDDVIGYTLSVQKGDNLVTNPEPGTISQMTMAVFGDPGRPPRFTIARFAKPDAKGAPLKTSVMTVPNMATIIDVAKSVEAAYCKNKPGYYSGDCKFVPFDNEKTRSLDMEFKFLENGHFVLKQVREFHGQ